jgi:hypothetical protein
MMITGLILIGAGVVGLAVGGGLYQSEASKECTTNCDGSLNSGAVIGIVTMVASGVMVLVGSPLWLIGREEAPVAPARPVAQFNTPGVAPGVTLLRF